MSTVIVLLSILLVLVSLRRWVVSVNYVPSPSMVPTIVPGDMVMVNHLAYRGKTVRRNDVVVFSNKGSGDRLVKRVVGLPGDKVRFGESTITVPAFHYFMAGDNTSGSIDSRIFGPVPHHRIQGRATTVLGNIFNNHRKAHAIT